MSVLRTVRKRKKVRKLGSVTLDAKVELRIASAHSGAPDSPCGGERQCAALYGISAATTRPPPRRSRGDWWSRTLASR